MIVDIIAGLPGDSLSDVRKSMDWLIEKEAYHYLMLYPLCLMPSTELKRREAELGLVAMPFPPYLLTRNTGLTAQEMAKAFQYYEESMGEDISPLEMPLFIHNKAEPASYLKGLLSIIRWNSAETVRIDGAHTAYALTLSMNRDVLRQPGLWRRVLKDYLKKNPFSLFSIEVPSDAFPSELEPLWQVAGSVSIPLTVITRLRTLPIEVFSSSVRPEGYSGNGRIPENTTRSSYTTAKR